MGTSPHTKLHPKDVAVLDMIMGKKYLEIIGEEVPEAWEKPELLYQFKSEMKETSQNKYAALRGYVLPRGWRVSYDEERDRRYSYGMATDWAYYQYGIYSITTELWNFQKDIPDFPEAEENDSRTHLMRALLKYQDEKYDGSFFIPWEKYTHPELGEGEIGGWIPIYRNNAWPGKPLVDVCEKHWQFEHFRASLMPQIEISDIKAQVLSSIGKAHEARVDKEGEHVVVQKGRARGSYKVIEISVTVENKGKLATHLARGAELPGNREDVVWLIGDRDKVTFIQGTPYQKLGALEGAMDIPGYKIKGPSPRTSQQSGWSRYYRNQYYPRDWRPEREALPEKPMPASPRRIIKWVIGVEGNTPLKIVAASQKGGTKVEIGKTEVEPVSHDLYWVQVEVKNDRLYPTSSDRSVKLGKAQKDRLHVSTSNNISVVRILEDKYKLNSINNQNECIPVASDKAEFRLRGRDSQKFCILLKTDGGKGWVDFSVWSKNGGTDKKRIEFTAR
jgi:hypothetical protein